MEGITIAILGSGRMARAHFAAYSRHPRVARIVLWGRNAAAMSRLCRGLRGTDYYTDYDRMLADVCPRIVSVCLPPTLRAPWIVKAVSAGADVLCEKPLALDVATALEIRDAARRAHRHIGVAYVTRHLPEIIDLKSAIDAGRLGEIRSVFFRIGRPSRQTRWSETSGGPNLALSELGIHGVDLARFLISRRITRVAARCDDGGPQDGGAAGGSLILQFEGGALATLAYSLACPFFATDLCVVGTHMSARVTRGRVFLRRSRAEASLARLFLEHVLEGFAVPYRYLLANPYTRQVGEFVEAVLAGRTPSPSVEDDLDTLQACFGAGGGVEKPHSAQA